MTTYEEIKETADERWQTLTNGPDAWIRIGTAMCGHSAGAYGVIDALKVELERRDIAANIDEVGCLGLCYAEPLVDILRPGSESRLFFGNVTPDDVGAIVDAYLVQGTVPADRALGYLGEEPIPGVQDLRELPELAGSSE